MTVLHQGCKLTIGPYLPAPVPWDGKEPNQYRYIVPNRWSKAGLKTFSHFRSILADGVYKSQLTLEIWVQLSLSKMHQSILHFGLVNHPSNCNDPSSMLTPPLNTSLNISLVDLLPTQGDLD